MGNSFGMVIEGLVAILLMLTIGYCVLLNNRLKRLKADEQTLKATISELITATEIAERAIAGLKLTVRECDQNLGERLRAAEKYSADIARQIAAGNKVVSQLARIVSAAKPQDPESDTRAMVAAAQAFAERTRARVNELAA